MSSDDHRSLYYLEAVSRAQRAGDSTVHGITHELRAITPVPADLSGLSRADARLVGRWVADAARNGWLKVDKSVAVAGHGSREYRLTRDEATRLAELKAAYLRRPTQRGAGQSHG